MDSGALVTDSFAYAQEALVGKWARWVIFILLALPFSLVQFVFDPKKFQAGTVPDWNAVPWGQIALLFGIGIILSFFISGYTVRIYRGETPAPDFTGWGSLFIDGIKLAIVWFLWMLPLIIVAAGAILAAVAFFASSGTTPMATPRLGILLFVLLLILVELVLFVIVLLFGIIGAVRFARTGSIREGIHASAILATIRTMGWVQYIIALVVAVVVCVVYAVITGILSLIPFIGWVLVMIVAPFFTIFIARYVTLVYDQGEPKVVPPVTAI